ncbi:MAG: 50S ribosomal protein L9 [Saprospiraceae bacterium]|jgi:large subunit ribosomal protein L9
MQVILLDYIDKVGDKHDVVTVKAGYGRNFLIPKGLAMVANKANLARLEGLKKQFEKKEAAKVSTYREYANKVAATTFKLSAKAGESGRLFGSINVNHLLEAVRELGVEVEKRHFTMPDEVKELGDYTATLTYHPEVSVDVKFEVVAEGQLIEEPKKEKKAKKEEAPAPEAEASEEPAVEATADNADDAE